MSITFSFVSFIFFLLVSLTIFVLIVFKSVKNYRNALHSKGKITGKAAAAFLIWSFASLYVFFSNAVYSIGASHTVSAPPDGKIETAVIELIFLQTVWLLLGIGLIYWVTRKVKERSKKIYNKSIMAKFAG